MKSNKTAGKNKDPQKAAKKELQQNLSDKFFEAVKSLGHDAEKIGGDLMLVSKFVAKKLSKKISGGKKEGVKKVAELLPEKPSANKKDGSAKKVPVKGVKKAQKVVQKASANIKPVVNSVKVAAIASEDKLKEAIERPSPSGDVKVARAEKPPEIKETVAKRSRQKVKPADKK